MWLLLPTAAYTKVSAPTLPKNINTINIILETTPNNGVTPNDKPTVPIAEAVSNKLILSGISSIKLIIAPLKINNNKYN